MQNKQTFAVRDLVVKYINTKNAYKVEDLNAEYGSGEELLAHLYNDVVGGERNEEVWDTMRQYDQFFNEEALTPSEYEFLKQNFHDTVEFIMKNRIGADVAEVGTLPISVLEFAIKFMNLKDGDHVYLPNAGYGDAVMLLPKQKVSGYINGRFAWSLAQIRFFASGIEADIECLDIYVNKKGKNPILPTPGTIDAIITVYQNVRMMPELCYDLQLSDIVCCLSNKGKAFLLTDGVFLSNSNASKVIGKANSVIQFPHLLTETCGEVHLCLCGIYITQAVSNDKIDMIDVTSASCQGEEHVNVWDLDLNKALHILSEGTERVKCIEKSKLDNDISLPSYYFANRPKIGHSINKVMEYVDAPLTEVEDDMPVITSDNLSEDFSHSCIVTDSLAIAKKVKSPWRSNKFYIISEPCVLLTVDPLETKCGYIRDIPSSGISVASGIIMLKPAQGVSFETATLLLQADYVKQQLRAIAYSLHSMNSKKYFDKIIVWPEVYNDNVNDMLLLEEVEEQAKQEKLNDDILHEELEEQAQQHVLEDDLLLEELDTQHSVESFNYPDYSVESIEDSDIYGVVIPGECSFEELVSALDISDDERTNLLKTAGHGIKEQKQEMQNNLVESVEKLQEENRKLSAEYVKKLEESKQTYINEVRMRKHDMRPHLRQIASTERLMSYFLDQPSDIEELKSNVRNQLIRIQDAVKHLSDLVEHLTDEDKFGTPERFNIDKYFFDLADGEFYTVDYDCDEDMLVKSGFGSHRFYEGIKADINALTKGEIDMTTIKQHVTTVSQNDILHLDVWISPLDFDRLVQNIIENAKRHGFTDPSRKDYNILIDLTIENERGMFQIDFRNNGTPIPEGMTKDRFGIRGERGGKTGGTGQGGYIIKSIVEHYGGDYDIFSDNGITDIRIYLPIMR